MIDQDPLADLRQLKQDDPVVVIDNKSKRIILAHLHGFTEEGEVYVFKNGKTSFSSLRDKDPVQSVSLDEFTILPADDKTIPFLFLAETFGPLFTGIPKSHIKP
ncbi:MAG TPA: hypothetical protein VFM18_00975, partial [Methanosarcina sp.]|nr:hypothetical protein [Methanosarcina sp.]